MRKLFKLFTATILAFTMCITVFYPVAATSNEITAEEFFETETIPVYLAVTNNKNEGIIYRFLIDKMGYNSAAASGILANIYHESRFNPNAEGDRGTSYGICQWHNSRWDSMKTWCKENGYDWTTVEGQLYYLKKELSANNSNYLWNGKKIHDYMKSVPNTKQGAYDAAYYWCYYFEVPANREKVAVQRGNLAVNDYWPEWGQGTTTDGIVYNAEACLKVLQYASNDGTLTDAEFEAYDMDHNDIINATDALQILEKAAGIQ